MSLKSLLSSVVTRKMHLVLEGVIVKVLLLPGKPPPHHHRIAPCFRVDSSGFRVQAAGCFRVSGLGFKVQHPPLLQALFSIPHRSLSKTSSSSANPRPITIASPPVFRVESSGFRVQGSELPRHPATHHHRTTPCFSVHLLFLTD